MTRPLLVILIAVWCLQQIFLACALVPDIDEGGYLLIGRAAVRGELGLYDDALLGHRTPLPYYLVGVSQLFGRSLLAGRLASSVCGLLALGLVYALARRLHGAEAGALALVVATGSGVLAGAFAQASYHGLLAAAVVLLALLIHERRHVGAVSVGVILFFIRPIAGVVLLGLLPWAWHRQAWRTRALVSAVVIVPLAVFFASPTHWKLFAYVPGLASLVHGLGYVPVRVLDESEGWGAALRLVARWYKVWLLLAAGALLAPSALRACRGPLILFVALVGGHLLVLANHPTWGVAYIVSFLPLLAVWLGVAWASQARPWRLALLPVVALAPLVSPSPFLPRAVVWSVARANDVADDLRQRVPAGAHMFLFGSAVPLYLADRPPYLRQVSHLYAVSDNPNTLELQRSGQWGAHEIGAWLGHEAAYALIDETSLAAQRTHGDLMRGLLAQHFRRAAAYSLGGRALTLYERVK